MADFAKKLTVSFGAFSCTLSGFDDPFPVMSQVVDYFKALSQSDPSFGAHPERPDTEALRVLAEQTSGLSVGAQMQGDAVILSSMEDIPAQKTGDAAVGATSAPLAVKEVARTKAPVETPNATAPESPSDLPPEDLSSLVSKAMADAETDKKVNGISAEQPQDGPKTEPSDKKVIQNAQKIDPFDHLQIDDLKDEAFGDIDAGALYDAVDTPDPATPAQEDMSGYLSEAVEYKDIEHPEMDRRWEEDLRWAQQSPIPPELPQAADPVPVWKNALISDEPIEEIEQNPNAPLEDMAQTIARKNVEQEPQLTYDDHIEAEKRALALILAATQEGDAPQKADPLTALRNETAARNNDPNHARDAKNTTDSLVLGFGGAAGLDATGHVATGSLDTRSDPSSEALLALGMCEDDSDDFGWNGDDVTPGIQTEAAPLLLTPMQKVSSDDNDQPAAAQADATPPINLSQNDPRPNLRRFAAAAGAASMTELLEASAAYSTLIGGRPNFSRGEVLDLLDMFSDDRGFSQETRIKTFGSLLRGGRIQSVGNGDYEMTMDALSDYRTARRAG